jgi:arabinoxylan arabinofuranohydrolase
MYKKLFMTAAFMAACIQTNAQTLASEYKGTSNNNPISPCVYCADPTALEYNGRLYVYGSNDHQQFIKNGKKGTNEYGDIKSFVVLSTDDMVNWTFHGTIDVAKLCTSWGGGFFRSWAPSVTWRHNETTGKDEFFLYFANWASNVGVLTADSPLGPWKSPLTKALVSGDTPGVSPCNWCFDPGVVIDENGTGWLSFGGGDPNNKGTDIQPNNAGIIKLKSSMTAVDGKAVKIPAPYHFEASELNVMNGKYVYTYCSNWANRADADWNKYKSEHGISVSKPETCTMCYMVSDNPMDPDSWVYKGVYGPHASAPNNHSHLQKFNGKYYHIYHDGSLLDGMKNAKATDANASTYRSICVDEVTVDEATQTINKATLTAKGVSGIRYLNPYQLLQAETMGNCGGVNYEDFTNIEKNTSISALGNDASRNLQVKMKAGSWINQKRIDFGSTGADRFTLRAKGTGTLEIRFGAKSLKTVATINFSSTAMEEQTIEIDASQFKGTKSVYFVVTAADNFYVDAWQFTEVGSTGIQNIRHQTSEVRHQTYDLSGRRVSGNQQHRGIIIKNGKKYGTH